MEIYTSLSPDECGRRLQQEVDTRRFTWLPESHYTGAEVVGRVNRGSFKLRKRRHDRNSFAPVLVGIMETSPKGTVIKYGFRLPLVALVFLLAFPLFAASFIVVGFGWAPILIPLAIAVSPLLMYVATRGQAAQERDYLQGFLVHTLEAHNGHTCR